MSSLYDASLKSELEKCQKNFFSKPQNPKICKKIFPKKKLLKISSIFENIEIFYFLKIVKFLIFFLKIVKFLIFFFENWEIFNILKISKFLIF